MNKYLAWLLIPLYLVCWFGTAGAVNATFRTEFHRLDQSKYYAREDLVFSILWSAIPIFPWIITPILTGFYEDGWTLESKPFPCKEEYPDIWCQDNY
jgi:hypothetical protein